MPSLALTIWLALVPTQVLLFYTRLHNAGRSDGNVLIGSGPFVLSVPQNHLFGWVFESVAMRQSHTIMAIDLPGTLVTAIAALATFHPATWHPAGLTLDSWRAIAVPIACTPAWWFVGRGLDGAFRSIRSHWGNLLTGSPLFALFFVLFLGLRFATAQSDLADMEWIMIGSAIWTLALGVFPFRWFRQWRMLKMSRAQATSSSAGEAAAATSAAPPTPVNTISPGNEKG